MAGTSYGRNVRFPSRLRWPAARAARKVVVRLFWPMMVSSFRLASSAFFPARLVAAKSINNMCRKGGATIMVAV